MSVPNPVNPTQGPQESQQAQSQTGPTGVSQQTNASTMISTMKDLKEKAPELYKETMKSVAWTIVRQVRKSARRLKEIQRKARQGNG